jgi:hypothetical protein
MAGPERGCGLSFLDGLGESLQVNGSLAASNFMCICRLGSTGVGMLNIRAGQFLARIMSQRFC